MPVVYFVVADDPRYHTRSIVSQPMTKKEAVAFKNRLVKENANPKYLEKYKLRNPRVIRRER